MPPRGPSPAPARPLPARALLLSLGLLALAAVPAGRAAAAPVKPWAPPGADSIQSFVSEAKLRFRQADTDTITEENIVPFERVAQAARRLLRRLGRHEWLRAPAIEATLDSLGLDTDVVNDPDIPSIVLVLVRNPDRPSMQSVGYLMWYRGPDLRMQGMSFPPAVQPRLKSWWSGYRNSPYSTAVTYRVRSASGRQGFKLLRLSPDGFYWDLVQYEGNGPDLGAGGDAAWADLNHDGRPELVAYSPAPPDSLLMVEAPVYPVVREAIYTERDRGFLVHDARLVPGPLETLRQFVQALRAGEREHARRLLVDPSFLALAEAAGWASGRSPRNFVVDRQEEGQAWPEWLGARVLGVTGMRRWVFHFTLRDGRWLIKDWIAETPARPAPAARTPATTGGGRP